MATKYANYKGKTYRCEYIGATKFGRRARLAFMDGSKEFWVDASLVTLVDGPSRGSSPSCRKSSGGSGKCRDCGREITNAPHHRAMGGLCGDCAFDEYDC
jgi:hypothetical protein